MTLARKNQIRARKEAGWGMVLIFFILAFLIGLTLVAVRRQLTNAADVSAHEAAHEEYWRAGAFAADLEASLRSDLVGAYAEQVRQARQKEQQLDAKSRLSVFDAPGALVSRPLLTFPAPDAAWFQGPSGALQVPAGQFSGVAPLGCTSLLGSFQSWLTRHKEIPHVFAQIAPRNWPAPINGRLAALTLAYVETQQQAAGGYPQNIYVLDFTIEVGIATDGESALVRRQGRVTLGAAAGQNCPPPRVIRVSRVGAPAPVDAGEPLVFTWETDGAEEMRVQATSANGNAGPIFTVSLWSNQANSYAQTRTWGDNPAEGQIIATIDDPSRSEETMSVRFTAVSRCGQAPSPEIVVPIVVRQSILAGWSAPPFPGLRERRNNNADLMGFFYAWGEVRSAGANRLLVTVRVGYTMGTQNGSQQSNGAPVRASLAGEISAIRGVSSADGATQTLAGVSSISQGSPLPGLSRTFASRYMVSPQRGCEGARCQGQPSGSVNMTMQFQWELDRPPEAMGEYQIDYRFNATTIDNLRANHNGVYAMNAARTAEQPWFTGTIILRPPAAPPPVNGPFTPPVNSGPPAGDLSPVDLLPTGGRL